MYTSIAASDLDEFGFDCTSRVADDSFDSCATRSHFFALRTIKKLREARFICLIIYGAQLARTAFAGKLIDLLALRAREISSPPSNRPPDIRSRSSELICSHLAANRVAPTRLWYHFSLKLSIDDLCGSRLHAQAKLKLTLRRGPSQSHTCFSCFTRPACCVFFPSHPLLRLFLDFMSN